MKATRCQDWRGDAGERKGVAAGAKTALGSATPAFKKLLAVELVGGVVFVSSEAEVGPRKEAEPRG